MLRRGGRAAAAALRRWQSVAAGAQEEARWGWAEVAQQPSAAAAGRRRGGAEGALWERALTGACASVSGGGGGLRGFAAAAAAPRGRVAAAAAETQPASWPTAGVPAAAVGAAALGARPLSTARGGDREAAPPRLPTAPADAAAAAATVGDAGRRLGVSTPADLGGWTRDTVVNLPNALSLSRALSGPLIAHLILSDQVQPALALLAYAGFSDWADGYAARRLKIVSVLGSYLDPLADKALMISVYLALAAKGLIPAWLVAFVVGRDVLLVAGSFVHRARVLGWRWRGVHEYFRLVPGTAPGAAPSAPLVQPLLLSKANTVLQTALVAAALGHLGWGVPDATLLGQLTDVVAATTVGSSFAYAALYAGGRILR